jgi:hypothetical protein
MQTQARRVDASVANSFEAVESDFPVTDFSSGGLPVVGVAVVGVQSWPGMRNSRANVIAGAVHESPQPAKIVVSSSHAEGWLVPHLGAPLLSTMQSLNSRCPIRMLSGNNDFVH